MLVQHLERDRFYVESETQPDTRYLVELGANNSMGRCSCIFYATRIGVVHHAIAEFGREPEGLKKHWWRCKHIVAVREYLADELWQKLIE